MATNFPASLDTLTNPTSSDSLSSPSHSAQHANVNDAVEALQAKVGADSSAVTTSLDYKVAQLEAVSHGKILQIVRDTDTSERSTTSTSFVDATGVTVTITPTSATSNIMIVFSGEAVCDNAAVNSMEIQITDSSNVAISGAEGSFFGNFSSTVYSYNNAIMIGYASPASTSAQTYKVRFRASSGLVKIRGNLNTTQLFAIEVGA
jgi:hypothetical protein